LRYTTTGGRVVFGGGGIVPDFVVQEDTTVSGELFSFLIANRIDFDYVRDYLDENGEEFRERWEDDFQDFRHNFEWSESNKELLLSNMKENGLVFDSSIEAPEFEGDTLRISREIYNENLWVNLGRMKAELARQVWGSDKFYVITNDLFNDTLNEAMNLWDEANEVSADYASTTSPMRED
jgi:carboxyl-terminal processing protease